MRLDPAAVEAACGEVEGGRTLSELARTLGLVRGGIWTSPRAYVALRAAIRRLRAEGRVGKVGNTRAARYVELRFCACGHARGLHVWERDAPDGACTARLHGEAGLGGYCACKCWLGALPAPARNPSTDSPEAE